MAEFPTKVSKFVLLERIGEGGMAEVFKAQHEDGGPLVAIKWVQPRHEVDEHFVANFAAELGIAGALRHPNIVRVHKWDEGDDYYVADGYFYVMELVDGPDLATLIGEHGPLPADVVAYLGANLARALVHIHHRDGSRPSVVHCDVTPHNVLIDGSGSVKLSDFGVAKALGTTGAATLTRERGKAGYLAPEQLTGSSEALIDARVDLFALGLVLWRALIGTHPYVERCPPGESLARWIPSQLRHNRRRLVVEAAPTAPAGLCLAIDSLLQPLDSRTPVAEQVIAQLEPHVQPGSAAALGRIASAVAKGVGK